MAFKPPQIYNFPPFFTRQLNEQTWEAQKKHWVDLIVEYCRITRLWRLYVDSELFSNTKIQRTLKPETVKAILDYMVYVGKADWTPEKDAVWVYVKPLATIANDIRKWAEDTGNIGSIITFYEVSEGDVLGLKQYQGIEMHHLLSACEILSKKKLLTILKENNKPVAFKVL